MLHCRNVTMLQCYTMSRSYNVLMTNVKMLLSKHVVQCYNEGMLQSYNVTM